MEVPAQVTWAQFLVLCSVAPADGTRNCAQSGAAQFPLKRRGGLIAGPPAPAWTGTDDDDDRTTYHSVGSARFGVASGAFPFALTAGLFLLGKRRGD